MPDGPDTLDDASAVPVPPASAPESPYAIEKLVQAVEGLREDIREALARLEANYKLIVHELSSLQRARVDHEDRITALEGKKWPPSTSTRVAASVKRRRKKAGRK